MITNDLAKFIVWLWLWCCSFGSLAQTMPLDSVYQLRMGREIGLLAAGGAFNGAAYLIGKGVIPLEEVDIDQLNPGSINAFDRGATRNWSPQAHRISNVTLLSTVGLVGLTGLPTLRQRRWFTVPLLYFETMLLTVGVQDLVKVSALRTRPFVYNAQAPIGEKIDGDARRSFYSGHAAVSFGSAVFASTVFGHYFPVSKLKPVVWAGSLALASTTAYLRYEAGKHYPTDILTGAVVGSALGWLIPKIHEQRKPRPALQTWRWAASPWSNGVASGVNVQIIL